MLVTCPGPLRGRLKTSQNKPKQAKRSLSSCPAEGTFRGLAGLPLHDTGFWRQATRRVRCPPVLYCAECVGRKRQVRRAEVPSGQLAGARAELGRGGVAERKLARLLERRSTGNFTLARFALCVYRGYICIYRKRALRTKLVFKDVDISNESGQSCLWWLNYRELSTSTVRSPQSAVHVKNMHPPMQGLHRIWLTLFRAS